MDRQAREKLKKIMDETPPPSGSTPPAPNEDQPSQTPEKVPAATSAPPREAFNAVRKAKYEQQESGIDRSRERMLRDMESARDTSMFRHLKSPPQFRLPERSTSPGDVLREPFAVIDRFVEARREEFAARCTGRVKDSRPGGFYDALTTQGALEHHDRSGFQKITLSPRGADEAPVTIFHTPAPRKVLWPGTFSLIERSLRDFPIPPSVLIAPQLVSEWRNTNRVSDQVSIERTAKRIGEGDYINSLRETLQSYDVGERFCVTPIGEPGSRWERARENGSQEWFSLSSSDEEIARALSKAVADVMAHKPLRHREEKSDSRFIKQVAAKVFPGLLIQPESSLETSTNQDLRIVHFQTNLFPGQKEALITFEAETPSKEPVQVLYTVGFHENHIKAIAIQGISRDFPTTMFYDTALYLRDLIVGRTETLPAELTLRGRCSIDVGNQPVQVEFVDASLRPPFTPHEQYDAHRSPAPAQAMEECLSQGTGWTYAKSAVWLPSTLFEEGGFKSFESPLGELQSSLLRPSARPFALFIEVPRLELETMTASDIAQKLHPLLSAPRCHALIFVSRHKDDHQRIYGENAHESRPTAMLTQIEAYHQGLNLSKRLPYLEHLLEEKKTHLVVGCSCKREHFLAHQFLQALVAPEQQDRVHLVPLASLQQPLPRVKESHVQRKHFSDIFSYDPGDTPFSTLEASYVLRTLTKHFNPEDKPIFVLLPHQDDEKSPLLSALCPRDKGEAGKILKAPLDFEAFHGRGFIFSGTERSSALEAQKPDKKWPWKGMLGSS